MQCDEKKLTANQGEGYGENAYPTISGPAGFEKKPNLVQS